MTMTDPEPAPTGPYAAAADTYWRAGWRGVLPLPPRSKGPVPTGWTGNDGAWPSYPDIHAWIEDRPAGNLALRLPPGVLGLDVDQYDGKPGYLVLQSLENTLGELPATWRSTSRDDGMSGIRLYRIPEGMRWPGILGPGIETIRTGHRYAVAWPSIHPDTGATYRWITPDGATALSDVPDIDALPHLPAAWVEHLTKGETATDQPRADLDNRAAADWLEQRGLGTPCRHMTTAATRATADLTAGGSRHDAALAGTNRIAWLAGEGHKGAAASLVELRKTFLKVTSGDRGHDAVAEWRRMLTGAVQLAAAAHPNLNPDPCDDPFHGLIPKDTTWTQTATPAPSAATSTSPTHANAPMTPASTPQTSAETNGARSRDAVAMNGDAPSGDADDLTETQIQRNQAAAQEVERLRAQRSAMRILEREDEEQTIADRVRRKILDDKAAIEYKRQTEPPAPPFDMGTLADVLARPADPPMRAEGLIPWSGSALVVAQRKTGKTTLLLNYARALITGEKFLGEFDIIPIAAHERVAFLNYEVSAAQLARWAADAGIPDDRIILVNLRGRRNPLGHPDDRAALAAALRGQDVASLIVDPFGRAYTGQSQNDNGEVQSFLVGLEEFARADVGALDLMLATHAGWDGERTRGASALEDWGDVIITLTRDPDEEERRFMKAMGRDVDVHEDELTMSEDRTLTRTGNGSRKAQKGDRDAARLAVFVVRAARENPGCSKAQAAAAIAEMDDAPDVSLSGGRGDQRLRGAIEFAEKKGHLRVERHGKGKGISLYEAELSTTTSTTSTPPPGGGVPTTSTPVYGVEVEVPGSEGVLSTNERGGGQDVIRHQVDRGEWRQRAIAGRVQWLHVPSGDVQEARPW